MEKFDWEFLSGGEGEEKKSSKIYPEKSEVYSEQEKGSFLPSPIEGTLKKEGESWVIETNFGKLFLPKEEAKKYLPLLKEGEKINLTPFSLKDFLNFLIKEE